MKASAKKSAAKKGAKPAKASKSKSGPELLAPAGSLECFHAAVEAGANAVYLGLEENNARLRAKNFTAKTLSYLVPYAHKKKVKIQVALNTLVKQQELRELLVTINQLQQIGVDAVIVQDIGLAHLIRQHFPKITLHASTQMAIHNSAGLRTAEALGFKRVILSRELTSRELESIRKSTSLELEIFIHGALCYSISGLCLASSFLGGMSGNRGRCTQVCRRRFASLERSGFYFSPKDLSLIDHIPQLARIGIDSFKIEGRMKSAEYVYTVASAYRTILDNPASIDEVKEKLVHDYGREKTSLFFSGFNLPDIIDASKPSGTGLFIGTVLGSRGQQITIRTAHKVEAGDRLRFHGPEGFEGDAAKIAKVHRESFKAKVTLKKNIETSNGDYVYLISSKSSSKGTWEKSKIDARPAKFSASYPAATRIVSKLVKSAGAKKPDTNNDRLFIRIDNAEWLHMMRSDNCDGIIMSPEPGDVRHLLGNWKVRQFWLPKLIIALPPFVSQRDMHIWNDAIKMMRKGGIRQFMCSNIGQKCFRFEDSDTIYAGPEIWCLNRAAQDALAKQNFSRFSYSPEDDILNLKATASGDGFFSLFSLVPLFVSRIAPATAAQDVAFSDSKGNRFFTFKRNRLYYFVGTQPLCLTHRRDTLHELGIRNFVLDFSFCLPRAKYLHGVISLYHKKEKLEGSTVFNHKAGLK